MEILFQRSREFAEWKLFLASEPRLNAWAYSPLFLGQCGVFKEDDLSFAITEGKSLLAICPLFLTPKDGHKTFSDDGGYLKTPLVSSLLGAKKAEKVLGFAFSTIDELARKHAVAKGLWVVEPQPSAEHSYAFLHRYGCLDSSIGTQIVDLTKSKEELWSAIRKSFQSLINGGLKTYEFRVMDAAAFDPQLHEEYRLTHRKAAGRETRPKAAFDLRLEQVKASEASLIAASHGGKAVLLDYFHHSADYVYYGSSADDPDFTQGAEIPMGHATLWKAITHFKERGFRYLETGRQVSNQLLVHPTDKERAISFFKRGFGGFTSPLFRGIKYYDPSLRERELREALERILAVPLEEG